MKTISYGRQHITEADLDAVKEVLTSDYLTQGPQVEKFEKLFSEFVQTEHSVAVTNATAGLHLACLALDLKKDQRVITTSNTFVASANCVRYCDAHVDFVDIDPKNFCIDLNQVETLLKKINPALIVASFLLILLDIP
jgi:dTDP-4-amino-4,6-dideoxygalactose transaminase